MPTDGVGGVPPNCARRVRLCPAEGTPPTQSAGFEALVSRRVAAFPRERKPRPFGRAVQLPLVSYGPSSGLRPPAVGVRAGDQLRGNLRPAFNQTQQSQCSTRRLVASLLPGMDRLWCDIQGSREYKLTDPKRLASQGGDLPGGHRFWRIGGHDRSCHQRTAGLRRIDHVKHRIANAFEEFISFSHVYSPIVRSSTRLTCRSAAFSAGLRSDFAVFGKAMSKAVLPTIG